MFPTSSSSLLWGWGSHMLLICCSWQRTGFTMVWLSKHKFLMDIQANIYIQREWKYSVLFFLFSAWLFPPSHILFLVICQKCSLNLYDSRMKLGLWGGLPRMNSLKTSKWPRYVSTGIFSKYGNHQRANVDISDTHANLDWRLSMDELPVCVYPDPSNVLLVKDLLVERFSEMWLEIKRGQVCLPSCSLTCPVEDL